MALTFIGGIVLCLLSIVAATLIDGNSFGPLIGPSSFLLVFGCAIGASMISYELDDLKALPKAIIAATKATVTDFSARINKYSELADLARRDGLLALDEHAGALEDPFVEYGIQMLTDGVDETTLRDELTAWIDSLNERHAIAPSILRKLATYAPAFGMVGTVIGLINMLGNLASPESLGSGMAVALLTTLYGALFANLLFQPIAERLEQVHEAEMARLMFDADAILAIQAGTTPRNLVSHLESMRPPAERVGFDSRNGKEQEAA